MDTDSFTQRLHGLTAEDIERVASVLRADLETVDGELTWWRATIEVTGALKREHRSRMAGLAAHRAATAVVDAVNLLQWSLYYPAVIDPVEFRALESSPLRESVVAYRVGHLPRALERYPEGREPEGNLERIYLAALLLAAGSVEEAGRRLDAIDRATHDRLWSALAPHLEAVFEDKGFVVYRVNYP